MNWLTPYTYPEVGMFILGAMIISAILFGLTIWLAIRSRQRFEARRCKVNDLLECANLLSPRRDWEMTAQVLTQLGILYWKNLVELQPLRLRLSVFDERCDEIWLFGDVRTVTAILSDIIHNLDREDDQWASRVVAEWLVHSERFHCCRPQDILAQMIKRHTEIEKRLRLHIQFAEKPLVLKPSCPKTKPRTRATK